MPRPLDGIGVHPVVEQFGKDLYARTPRASWPADLRDAQGGWENIALELRSWFRDRARSFAAGDMRVAPWLMGERKGPT